MPRKAIDSPGIPISHLPFSPAIRAGDFVFVSGQASVDDDGAIVTDTFEGELRRSFANLERILRAARGTLNDVVSVRAYLGSLDDRDEFNRLYREFFAPPLPARTTTAGGIGSLKFEVDAVAYLPVGDSR